MDYGTLFCNNNCPANNNIPDFNDLVFHGDWKAAIDSLPCTVTAFGLSQGGE